MAGTMKRIAGPAYLAASATNIYTPPASTMGLRLRRLHFCNTDSVIRTFSVWIGATGGSAGGTEIFKDKSLPAKDVYTHVCDIDMASTDFLSGLASSASTITVTVEAEQYVK